MQRILPLYLVGTVLFVFLSSVGWAQHSVYFSHNTLTVYPNINENSQWQDFKLEEVEGYKMGWLTFQSIPNQSILDSVGDAGIILQEYVKTNTYLAAIPSHLSPSSLLNYSVEAITPITSEHKEHQRIWSTPYPAWALEGDDIKLSVRTYAHANLLSATDQIQKIGGRIEEIIAHSSLLTVRIPQKALNNLLSIQSLRSIDLQSEPGRPESDEGRNLHRSNAIDNENYGGRSYDGTGVSQAVNDDGFAGPHIDFKGRNAQATVANDLNGDHGDMVAGIAGGAGNLDPTMRGMAPGSFLYVRQYNANMGGTLDYHLDSNVLVFNSSYSNGCNAGYTNTTVLVDQEIYDNPTLMQVFSAGNSNGDDCGYGAGNQWGNITGGHKVGKNVIATANLGENDNIQASSSRGPASDGRIKPDISAHGNYQTSTDPNNTYASGGGTSAAAPGIAGCFTQLQHVYKTLNNGSDGPSALLKAVLLNTANDLGNDGPDFIHGWGKVNALKATVALEEGRYLSNSVSQGTNNTHTINVPAGTSRLKVMVYWADPEGSTSAAQALVNNLDATMTDGSNVFFPWLLDTTANAASLNQPASRGIDNLNNVEQIAIDNPNASSYTLTVSGNTIPFGSAQYWVTWEYISDTPVVIFPMGGEGLEPNTNVRIHWDAWNATDNFLVEYSLDGGNTWSPISTVLGSLRILTWTTPNVQSGQARIRITQNGLSGMSAENFSLMRRPENVRVDRVCQDDNQIILAWDPVDEAFNYDIFLLGSQYMDSIGSTTDTLFNVTVSDLSEEQWLAVRANGINGMQSNRTIAIPFEGLGSGGQNSCVLSCKSDIDAGVQAITSSLPDGDLCNQNVAQGLDILVENLGDIDLGFVEVNFQVNDGPIVSEFLSGTLPSRSSLAHSFGSILFIDRPGSNTLKIWTSTNGDSTQCNDTLYRTINLAKADLPDNTTQQGCLGKPAVLTFDNLLGEVTWFNNGNPVGQGPTFTTPNLTFQRFYQAQQTIPSSPLQAGPSGTDFGGGGYHGSNSFFPALEFDADTNFIIKSVLVDADGAGDRTIEIRQGISNGNAIYSETFSLIDGPQRIELDAAISGPGTYFIGGNDLELYRNNSGTDYPYNTEGVVTITRSTATTDPDAYYYYFYDWEIALGPCVGNLVNVFAEPVGLSITASGTENNIDFSASTINSSLNDEWEWDFGDGGSSTDASPSHTYYNVGDYTVRVTANEGCSRDTVITITTISNIEDPEVAMMIQVYPNPGNDIITLYIESLENYSVKVFSADGKRIQHMDGHAGNRKNLLNTSTWSQGIYWIYIESNEFNHTLPLIIE